MCCYTQLGQTAFVDDSYVSERKAAVNEPSYGGILYCIKNPTYSLFVLHFLSQQILIFWCTARSSSTKCVSTYIFVYALLCFWKAWRNVRVSSFHIVLVQPRLCYYAFCLLVIHRRRFVGNQNIFFLFLLCFVSFGNVVYLRMMSVYNRLYTMLLGFDWWYWSFLHRQTHITYFTHSSDHYVS